MGGLPSPPPWPGLYTLVLADLPEAAPHRPQLLDHHLLMLFTAGHGRYSVDFVSSPCRPGTLVWAYPGQAIGYGDRPGPDAILLGWRADLMVPAECVAPYEGTGHRRWQLTGEDEDAIINEVSQLVVDCERYRDGDLPGALLRHQLAGLLLRIAALPTPATAAPEALGASTTAEYPAAEYPAAPGTPARATTAENMRARDMTTESRATEYPGVEIPAARGTPARATTAGSTTAQRTAAQGTAGRGTTGRGTAAGGDDMFVRFRREVELRYRATRRVEDYASRLGCSVRTLTRACLAATGESAKQFIDDRVALQARRLLACTDLPVAAVGAQLGFPEPTNFGRFFHREVGCSPGAFRTRAAVDPSPLAPREGAPTTALGGIPPAPSTHLLAASRGLPATCEGLPAPTGRPPSASTRRPAVPSPRRPLDGSATRTVDGPTARPLDR